MPPGSLAFPSDAEVLSAVATAEPVQEAELIDATWDDAVAWDRLELILAFADEIGRRAVVDRIAPLFALAPLEDLWAMT
jgi:hypothetical protein